MPINTFALVNFHHTYSTTGLTHCIAELDAAGNAIALGYGMTPEQAATEDDDQLREWDTFASPEPVAPSRFEVLRTFLPGGLAPHLTGTFTLERLVTLAADEPSLNGLAHDVANRIAGYQDAARQPGLDLVAELRRGAILEIRLAA